VFVQSKNPNQCRIFHKRVVENYGSLEHLFEYIVIIYDGFEQKAREEERNISSMLSSLRREREERKERRKENC
jgi:hypothetical protein